MLRQVWVFGGTEEQSKKFVVLLMGSEEQHRPVEYPYTFHPVAFPGRERDRALGSIQTILTEQCITVGNSIGQEKAMMQTWNIEYLLRDIFLVHLSIHIKRKTKLRTQ